ncbi:hypothetical protein AAV99_08145 [Aurantiacibacter marinus]|uniref:Uncharacterized protein n=1 Tax=Aurantiacibacter marinus TaxID=874156 RepID=A0A0H0XMV3_9SPHN|nr:hypothetical protein AAV99_08145 [Aurantiacibacter marinus]
MFSTDGSIEMIACLDRQSRNSDEPLARRTTAIFVTTSVERLDFCRSEGNLAPSRLGHLIGTRHFGPAIL